MEDVLKSTEQGTATSAVPKRTRKPTTKSKTALKDELREAKAKIKELEGKAPAVQVKSSDEETVTFFSEADYGIDKNGREYRKNAYPFGYNEKVRDDLVNEVSRLEAAERDAMINPNLSGHLGTIKEQLSKARSTLDKLDDIQNRATKNPDAYAKLRKSLGEKISEAMYRRTDQEKGTTDHHEEARREVEPCIQLSPQEAKAAIDNGYQITKDMKISRGQAVMIWQNCGRKLGESRNAEILRRD